MELDDQNSNPGLSLFSRGILGKSHIFPSLCLHLFDGDNIGPDIRCKEIRHIMCITQCLVPSRSINIGDPERLCGLSKVTQGRHTRFLGWADF